MTASGQVQLCRSCGARYDFTRFACERCDVGLVEEDGARRVLPYDGDGAVVPVEGRTFRQRTELVDHLEREGIRHRWEDAALVVAADDADLVRALLGEAPQADTGVGEPGRHEEVEQVEEVEEVEQGEEGEEGEEVGYELDDWLPDQQAELVARLAEEGIPNYWDGAEVVVPGEHADRVEELIDEIDHPDALAVEDDDAGDAGAELLGGLFVAADVLQHDPADPAAVRDLLDLAERVDVDGVPYGLDVALWDAIRRMAGDLADLLAERADEERVTAAARALRDALRDLV